MEDVERIESGGKLLALVIRNAAHVEGLRFFTPGEHPFQIGTHNHEGGYAIQPHIHKIVKRVIDLTEEFFYIISGKVEVSVYDNDKSIVSKIIANTGDAMVLVSGGHSFNFLEKTRMIEVKQGPYSGMEQDKEKFGGKL